MKSGGRGLSLLGCVLVLSLASSPARALTDEEVFREFRFNFTNPSARALGLGGAFVAEADDATAAQANPAALHYIQRWEVFVEYRLRQSDPIILGSPELPPPGSIPDLEPGATTSYVGAFGPGELAPEDSRSLSYFAIAYPFSVGGRPMRLALARQLALDYSAPAGSSTTRSAQPDFPAAWVNTRDYGTPVAERYSILQQANGSIETQLVNYSAALSYAIHRDFSLGVSANYYTLDMKGGTAVTIEDPRQIVNFGNPREDDLGNIVSSTRTTAFDGTDSKVAWTIGLHWHPDLAFPSQTSPWRFGAVYRKGVRLSVPETVDDAVSPIAPFDNVVRIPDRFAVGGSYHSPVHWIFALDYERIKYSQLVEDYKAGVNFLTDTSVIGDRPIEFTADDADVFHAGIEFNASTSGRWLHQFRAGYYNAPDNRIRLKSFPRIASDTDDAAYEAQKATYFEIFGPGEDENHVTAGYAITTPGNIALQLAADFGDKSTEYVASAIFRFGKVRF